MDGSPAEVDLFDTVLKNPKVDGEIGLAFWNALPADKSADWGRIIWQHGPLREVGRNGILLEELLEFVVIPRLQGFNRESIPVPYGAGTGSIANPFRNRETSLAITALEEGLLWLKRRTELRRQQGVEGTFQPHRSVRSTT